MEYPKQIMSKPELERMGFPKALLQRAYRDKNQTFAQRVNPLNEKSTIIFDTAGFEAWRQQQIKMEARSMTHRRDVVA